MTTHFSQNQTVSIPFVLLPIILYGKEKHTRKIVTCLNLALIFDSSVVNASVFILHISKPPAIF